MTAQEYTAIALARWIIRQAKTESDFAREGLPLLDVEAFFRFLAQDSSFPAEDFSIAVSGFGLTAIDLQQIAHRTGLKGIREFADDLHVAAEWRNHRIQYPRAIAIASGYNPGVHTLGHYARPPSMDLARMLLDYARDTLADRDPGAPEIHRQLLSVLARSADLESLLSLESCARFLARWDELRPRLGNRAPLHALPALGLLRDDQLFAADDLGKRLALNLVTLQQVRVMSASSLQQLAKRPYRDASRREMVVNATDALATYLSQLQRGEEGQLSLAQALVVIRPPRDEISEETDTGPEPEGKEAEIDGKADNPATLGGEAANALLDGREEDLAAIADAIEYAWEELDHNATDDLSITITLPSTGQEFDDVIPIDRHVLEWVQAFCTEMNWGGFFETRETSLQAALNGAADRSPIYIHPQKVVTIEGEAISMEGLLSAWDEDLPNLVDRQTNLATHWREFCAIRAALLGHLPKLLFHVRPWLDGRPVILGQIRRYLELAGQIYREVQENYDVMASHSPDWAWSTLEVLLALDIIQIRVCLPNGKHAAKAVLLPTHPLYLWRNERLSTLLRGLALSTALNQEDRDVIRKELERPEQFLSIVRLGSLPNGQGLNQLLPLSAQINGLPVFENLLNACSGSDGASELRRALDQYVILHPNHPFPLRLTLVNPPQPEFILVELVRLLNDSRYRAGKTLSAICVDVFATVQHADRLRAALCFADIRNEDLIQEKIASGRLRLRVHEECLAEGPDLSTLVERLGEHPSHIVAIFDESTIRIRRRGIERNLPMSPFCIRYEIRVDQRSGRIELQPQPGESPFSEFLLLMGALEGNQRDATPHAWADAEALAETVDRILQSDKPAARWLFLADRALPSEAGMQSVRIWERRDGQRDTFLATRNFTPLARLIRPVFGRCNLTVSPEHMARLLHQGARLLGSGVLEIIRKGDGQPDSKKVVGFAGLLFAARDFQRRYPGCLVLSVDHPLARLWLRTGSSAREDRCDLLVLWKDEQSNSFHLMAAEVKASDEGQLNDGQNRIAHAVVQIEHTLAAVQDGLAAANPREQSPLSIPRCEMLKQTLARAAQTRTAGATADRANRRRWGKWLTEIFGQAANGVEIPVNLSGCVISVLLRAPRVGMEGPLPSQGSWTISHRILGEHEISELLEWEQKSPEPDSDSDSDSDPKKPMPASSPVVMGDVSEIERSNRRSDSGVVRSNTPDKGDQAEFSSGEQAAAATRIASGGSAALPVATSSDTASATSELPWPPPVNALGMIGQYEAVERLVEQAVFAKTTGQRFSDKLLVGPAGVGKSTLARRIGAMLLNREPLFFSGADLRRASDILERLMQERLVGESARSDPIMIAPCLIFIDEVHGISSSVAIMLLSAMDDRRVTSIDGQLYDFSQVIFLLATTDQGKLSEAFQSRPNKTSLRPYRLHELAGIIWLHGCERLDGTELTREACYEIAARVRCNPRRSVRALSEVLLPHFFSRILREQGSTPTLRDAANLMNAENIAAFFDTQGIDPNGIDEVAMRFMHYLKQHGTASEATLSQALGVTRRNDFQEIAEYLVRLGLVETSHAGRRLTREGIRYLSVNPKPDLRNRISRAFD